MKNLNILGVVGLVSVMLCSGILAAPTGCPSALSMAHCIAHNYETCNKDAEYYHDYHCEHAYEQFSQWKSAAGEKGRGAIQDNSSKSVFSDLTKESIDVNKPFSVNPIKKTIKS